MPRPTIQSGNWDYKVSSEKMFVASPDGGFVPSGYWANIRDDSRAVLGVVSQHYKLTQNSELMESATLALERMGFPADSLSPKVIVAGQGERVYVEFSLKDKNSEIVVGDLAGYKIIVKNSFNREIARGVNGGFVRWACTNGMVRLDENGIEFKEVHSAHFDSGELERAITQILGMGQQDMEVFKCLASIAIDNEQGLRIIDNLVKAKALANRLAEEVKPVWLNPPFDLDIDRNLYNLYNALTFVLTRQVESERYEHANKVNFAVLKQLDKAAKQSKHLESLLRPVDVKTTIIKVG